MNPAPGRGFFGAAGRGAGRRGWFGRGRGGGRGWRNRFYATGIPGRFGGFEPAWLDYPGASEATRAERVAALRESADYLEQSLAEVRRRLEELEEASEKNE
jgi:hypothetical protein